MDHVTHTLLDQVQPETYVLPKCRLRAISGRGLGRERVLDRRLSYVGSAPDNDLVVEDPSVSRTHFKIEGDRTGYKIRDLESKNGTFVNGVRAVEAYLPPNATIRIGATDLEFRLLEETHEVMLSRDPKFGGLIGGSSEMREIFALLARVAPTDATVLIEGESGTGKELVAEALHHHSMRRNKPLVVFDCSAVPAELMESELFGHEKGAFTGAVQKRLGALAEADGGTLFLDEIGELPLDMQPKLLRAIEKREVKPVGSNERRIVDVRIVAATNRNLEQEVADGTFRKDLFWRLAVIHVPLPPMRRRKEDIPLLVNHFLAELAARQPGRPALTVSFETMARLQQHTWPGNVRELKNYVERAAVLSEDGEIAPQLISPVARDPGLARAQASELAAGDHVPVDFTLPFKDAKARLVDVFERAYWQRVLETSRWNISAAARASGIHRKSLEYLLKKLDLREPRGSTGFDV